MHKPPVITLLTDFGLSDPYVAEMKGVILCGLPEANIIDITHGIPPQNIAKAAMILEHACKYFPKGTVHLAVVDPEVGSKRKIIAAKVDGQFFVAPDNGILSPVISAGRKKKVVVVDRPDLYLKDASSTFHGRDKMAPVAASVALSGSIKDIGEETPKWERMKFPRPEVGDREVTGEVIIIDNFGNAITNIKREDLAAAAIKPRKMTIHFEEEIIIGLCGTYSDVYPESLLALFNSYQRLEIAIRNGNAASHLGLVCGSKITVTSVEKG